MDYLGSCKAVLVEICLIQVKVESQTYFLGSEEYANIPKFLGECMNGYKNAFFTTGYGLGICCRLSVNLLCG